MPTYHLHLSGRVQGVGFRPFVYRLARQYGLGGWVRNDPDGVHLRVSTNPETWSTFYQEIINRAPAEALILRHRSQELPEEESFADFQIAPSNNEAAPQLLITPDLDTCEQCLRDMKQPDNRRSGYAFITCTHCGPRYSLMTGLPYDRPLTTMADYVQCPACNAEYRNPDTRRHHSQTNSCPQCGVRLWLEDREGQRIAAEQDAIEAAVAALREGAIVAVKGIGGYLLLVDAIDEAAITTLRQRKQRPTKPFALMFPHEEMVAQALGEQDAWLRTLSLRAKPVVIFPFDPAQVFQQLPLAFEAIAPGLTQLGVMLPYTPLFHQLLAQLGRPVVATSGNLSGSPVIFDDQVARHDLGPLADYLLIHDRPIVTPQDDSVIRVTPGHGRSIVLRRSRGLAPSYLPPSDWPMSGSTLAMGAQLKAAFALAHHGQVYLSQYLGDLHSFDSAEAYSQTLDHMLQLVRAEPQRVVVDLHPDYFATHLGEELASKWGVPLHRVQHHEAHAAAVLAENDLWNGSSPTLVVVWDGTGLGHDGHIWGGEFFSHSEGQLERVAHFRYVSHLSGDQMALQPRLAALSFLHGRERTEAALKPRFEAGEWQQYQHLLARPDGLQTSSVGRLFDAAGSLLGLGDLNRYEGEVALQVELLAQRGLGLCQGLPSPYPLFSDVYPDGGLILHHLMQDLTFGTDPAIAALRFHVTLVHVIELVAEQQLVQQLAFSGGVFQNALLVDLLIDQLGGEYQLFFHQQLSPNDENIAWGQLVYLAAEMQ
jgi:hydrogenase maturation protein HypF